MQIIEFCVDKVTLTCSADICAKYKAQAEIVASDQGFHVEVLNTVPEGVAAGLLEASITHIRQAVESVLQPRGVGAIVRLRDLYIHDVGLQPASVRHADRCGPASGSSRGSSLISYRPHPCGRRRRYGNKRESRVTTGSPTAIR